jgi:hypothetical protein
LQPPFPGTPWFYHHAPLNMTPHSQPSTGATERYLTNSPLWQAYAFSQQCYGGPQMFPPHQFTGHGPWFSGAPVVPPAPPRNKPIIRLTSSSSAASGWLPQAPVRPHICCRRNWFQPAAKRRWTDVTRIADLPPFTDSSYDMDHPDIKSNSSLGLGGAQGKVPISL